MELKLTSEQAETLRLNPNGVEFIDETTRNHYVVVSTTLHTRAIQALHRENDLIAIRDGLSAIANGDTLAIDEADSLLREKLGFPKVASE